MDAQTPMSEPAQPGAAAVDPGDQPLLPEEEISEIEKLLAVEPDDFQARCRLGELYFSQGRLDDALAEVKKSIEMAEGLRAEMNRSLAMYYSNLGTIYATKNMTDEAEAEFRHALDVFPHDVLALFNLGRVYADKKKYMEAKGYYERLVEITPDDPIAWYNLAGVYIELDNPQVSDYNTIDMGIQCYLRTLELDPKHLESSFKLMEIALNHKKTDLAVTVMENAVEHNPDEPLAYYNLISVYDKCKLFEKAEAARKRLRERFAKKTKDSSGA
ncbi:MAG: tetratricopeptide repeat protein [Nitrospira sp.]|nr:tetratricopeptide repeat protein [Nitrospira sp.]MDH4327708.1 tetratricopeptide repeat protein [Nitrospira sp.]